MRPRFSHVLAILLAALIACSSTSLGQLLIVTGDGGVSAVDMEGEIAVLEEGGDGITSQQPTWSPDGRLAVWTLIDQANSEFAIRMGDADNQRRIDAPTAPFFYHWSPEGDVVAFLGNAPQEDGVALGLVDVASGSATVIDGGAPYFFDWDPSGERLAIHVAASLLAYVDLEGNRTEIGVTSGRFQTPQFLPDGNLLVVTGPPQHLAVVRSDGAVDELAAIEGISMFSSNPTGDQIAYTDSGQGQGLGELKILDLTAGDGSGPGSVALDSGQVAGFEWDPSGNRLLFFRLDLDRAELVPVVWSGGETEIYPGFTPSVAFLTQYLPFWDQYTRSLSLWSPEGDAFVLPVDGDRILVQHLDEDAPTEVATGIFASWRP